MSELHEAGCVPRHRSQVRTPKCSSFNKSRILKWVTSWYFSECSLSYTIPYLTIQQLQEASLAFQKRPALIPATLSSALTLTPREAPCSLFPAYEFQTVINLTSEPQASGLCFSLNHTSRSSCRRR